MPKSNNQKLKLIRLIMIMMELTDDEHGLTMSQIIDELSKYGINSERKSIYRDFENMELIGIDVIKEKKGRDTVYYIGNRKFEIAEVKLLIDAIQSSKFITQSKSTKLIYKLSKLVSKYQAEKLKRDVFTINRVKTMNESVYINVDAIHEAINSNKMISFKYYMWNTDKKLIPKHNNVITVSPWSLTWNNEYYYLVAYDNENHIIKHYRVDKMKYITKCEKKREGRKIFENFDMAQYYKATFGMYGGNQRNVKLLFENGACGIIIDRFGKDIMINRVDANYSVINVDINISPQFFGWLFSLKGKVKLLEPKEIVDELKEYAEGFIKDI